MKKSLTLTVLTALLALVAVAILAQGTAPAKAPQAGANAKLYICTMCEYAADKPGKCPECGMNLKEVDRAAVSYVCTMCSVTSDKPGKCPKCGMTMKMKVAEPAAPKTK